MSRGGQIAAMPSDPDRHIHLPDADATRDFARRLAPLLSSGDVVTLSGPIGAGKSDMARAIIQTRAGSDIPVPSPTFTLLQPYDLGDIRILHADLYRLGDTSELVELGLEDYRKDHLLLIEWPERAGPMFEKASLAIALAVDGDSRRLTMSGPLSARVLEEISDHV